MTAPCTSDRGTVGYSAGPFCRVTFNIAWDGLRTFTNRNPLYRVEGAGALVNTILRRAIAGSSATSSSIPPICSTQEPDVTTLKTLYIETNHGYVELANVELVPFDYDGRTLHTAKGTVVSGCETSRLFSATSTKHFEPGSQMSYPIHGRKPHCTDAPTDSWAVSCRFCG